MHHFGVHPHNSGHKVRIFFKILFNEKGQQVDESNNKGLYPKKICSGQMGNFGPENGTSHNSGSALRIFLKFRRMKGANT